MDTHRQAAAGENRPPNLWLWSFVGTYGVKRYIDEHGCSVYLAASLMSRTARPLYAPHLAQARWGSFFSWQFGHSETPTAVRKSWERRSAVRRVEWRLFGLGMTNSFRVSAHFKPGSGSGALGLYCPMEQAEHPQSLGFMSQDLIRPRSPASASQRGSLGPTSQLHIWLLRFSPQRGQSPLQSALHSVLTGRDKSTCSRSTSSRNRLSF